MSWASIAETQTYTGITVSADNISAAQAMIELFADVTEDSEDNISPKNLRLLKMAVAYQAAWISDHPDVFTHIDVGTMLQDGLQFTLNHENAAVLAPMARRAIARLSWRRNRSIRIRHKKRNLFKQTWQFGPGGSLSEISSTGSDGGSKNNSPFQDDDLPWQQE